MLSNIPRKYIHFIQWVLLVSGLIIVSSIFFGSNTAHIVRVTIFGGFVAFSAVWVLRLFLASQNGSNPKSSSGSPPESPVVKPASYQASSSPESGISLKQIVALGHQMWQQVYPVAPSKRSRRGVSANRQNQMARSRNSASTEEERTVFKPIQMSPPVQQQPGTISADTSDDSDDRTTFNPAPKPLPSVDVASMLSSKGARDEDDRTRFNPIQAASQGANSAPIAPLPESSTDEKPAAIASAQSSFSAAEATRAIPLPAASIEAAIQAEPAAIEKPIATEPVQPSLPSAKPARTIPLPAAEASIQAEPATIELAPPSRPSASSSSIKRSSQPLNKEERTVFNPIQNAATQEQTQIGRSRKEDADDRTSFNPIQNAATQEQTQVRRSRQEDADDRTVFNPIQRAASTEEQTQMKHFQKTASDGEDRTVFNLIQKPLAKEEPQTNRDRRVKRLDDPTTL